MLGADMSDDPNPAAPKPWFGMVFVWFFFNFGFAQLFLMLLAWIGRVHVRFDTGQSGLGGYVWMIIGCFMLGLFFAAPRRV